MRQSVINPTPIAIECQGKHLLAGPGSGYRAAPAIENESIGYHRRIL